MMLNADTSLTKPAFQMSTIVRLLGYM